jgi:hypothetical protein
VTADCHFQASVAPSAVRSQTQTSNFLQG